MKKSLILGLLGLAATIVPSFGQGIIVLDNYNTGGPNITYGANVAANGVSGANGTAGAPINNSAWTAGLYWVAGNQLANIAADPSGFGIPTGGGIALATGTGSTAVIAGPLDFNTAGQFLGSSTFTTPGVAAGGTITLEIIAYGGASYANANSRGHSAAFTMTVSDPTGAASPVGSFMSGFSVQPVPEPTVFALAGIGAAALMIVRRKK